MMYDKCDQIVNKICLDFEPTFLNNLNILCTLTVEIQPKSNYRLRYFDEGNHGVITHKQSEEEFSNKIYKFPKVRFQLPAGFHEERTFYVLVTLHNFDNKCLSPHLLMHKSEIDENYDFIFEEMDPSSPTEFTWELENYKIIRCKEGDYQFSLDEKRNAYQLLNLPMDFRRIQGRMNIDDIISLKKFTGLNVCLGFTIFEKLAKEFRLMKETTFSDGIFHGDTFRIQKICSSHGSFKSSTEITLLTNFKPKYPMKVFMYKNEWRKEIQIENNDPKSAAITFQAPQYDGKYLNQDIEVYLEVVVGDLFYKSNRNAFLYKSEDLAPEDKKSLRIYKICNTEGYINDETEITLLIKLYTNCPIEVVMYKENPITRNIEWSATIPIKNDSANEMIFNQSAITFKAPTYGGRAYFGEDIEVNVQVRAIQGDLLHQSNSVKFLYKNSKEEFLKHKRPRMAYPVSSMDCSNFTQTITFTNIYDNHFSNSIDSSLYDFYLNNINDTMDSYLETRAYSNKEYTSGNIKHKMDTLKISETKELSKNFDNFKDLLKQLLQRKIDTIKIDPNIHHVFVQTLYKIWSLLKTPLNNSNKIPIMLSKFCENFKLVITSATVTTSLPIIIYNCDYNCILKTHLLIGDFSEKPLAVEKHLLQMFKIKHRKDCTERQREMFTRLMDLIKAIVKWYEQTDINALDGDFWLLKSFDLTQLMKLIRYYVLDYPRKPVLDLPHSLEGILESPENVINHLSEMIKILSNTMTETFSFDSDLKCIEPCQPAESKVMEYNMNHKKRGVALIFGHEYFDNPFLKSRNGSKTDCEKLMEAFKHLDFEVKTYKNSKLFNIIARIEDASLQDYSEHDCIAISILNHGSSQGYLHANDFKNSFDKILEYFSAQRCPTLAGKPKIFFIQACNSYSNKLQKTETDVDTSSVMSYRIPVPVDYLIAYSTIPVFEVDADWRNIPTGSLFIQTLANEFKKNGKNYDLLTLLTSVNRRVAMNLETDGPTSTQMSQLMQIPCISSMLTRTLRFRDKTKKESCNIKMETEMAAELPYTSIVFIVGVSPCNEEFRTITETFHTLFNAEVVNWFDLSADGLKTNISDLQTNSIWLKKLRNCKFVAIFYLFDGQEYYQLQDISTIKRLFLKPLFKIRELDKKLKWLVVKSCRGNSEDDVKIFDTRSNAMDVQYYRDYYCLCYIVKNDFQSNRQNRGNAPFIEDLCRELERNAKTETLDEMLANVNWSVNRYAKTRFHFEHLMIERNFSHYNFFK